MFDFLAVLVTLDISFDTLITLLHLLELFGLFFDCLWRYSSATVKISQSSNKYLRHCL